MDDQLRRALYRAIYGEPGLSRYSIQAVPSIHIIVKNGNVTLEGAVDSEADKNLAGIRANQVPNVFFREENWWSATESNHSKAQGRALSGPCCTAMQQLGETRRRFLSTPRLFSAYWLHICVSVPLAPMAAVTFPAASKTGTEAARHPNCFPHIHGVTHCFTWSNSAEQPVIIVIVSGVLFFKPCCFTSVSISCLAARPSSIFNACECRNIRLPTQMFTLKNPALQLFRCTRLRPDRARQGDGQANLLDQRSHEGKAYRYIEISLGVTAETQNFQRGG